MKKIISSILVLCLLLTVLVGCSLNNISTNSGKANNDKSKKTEEELKIEKELKEQIEKAEYVDYVKIYKKPEDYIGKYVRVYIELTNKYEHKDGYYKYEAYKYLSGISNAAIFILNKESEQVYDKYNDGDYIEIVGLVDHKDDEKLYFTNCAIINGGDDIIASMDEAILKDSRPVNITDIKKAYDENELKANSIYEDTFVKITGKVDDISSSSDSATIYLTDPLDKNDLGNFKCEFIRKNEIDKIMNISKGENVTVIGRFIGEIFVFEMRDCRFIQ